MGELEIIYNNSYLKLPTTIRDAIASDWIVSDECKIGLGRRAITNAFISNADSDKGKAINGAMHLWFDKSGAVMGFGVHSHDGVAKPWRKVDDGYEIDFLLRDPDSACGHGPTAVSGSIGDRLVLVQDPADMTKNVAIPLTLQGAADAGYNNGGPCFPEMGWHMMYNRWDVSSPVAVYDGPAKGGKLLAMNLNAYTKQLTPSYESDAPKEGSEVYGWHVYFRDHKGTCEGSPTAAAPAGPSHHTAPGKRTPNFKCTPYFGNLWVMTLTSVVDVHASGDVCGGEKNTCTFVNYLGPTNSDVMATPCEPPVPTDGCHCYHQVTYNVGCNATIVNSDMSSKIDDTAAFDSNGVLKQCAHMVTSHTVVGWAPGPQHPVPCECRHENALLV